MPAELNRLERYYDLVPRASASAESIGPFTLFVAAEKFPFPYYARPSLDGDGAFTVGEVEAVRDRQRALGLPQTFEWVEDVSPALGPVVEAAGLVVQRHPLMVMREPSWPDDPPGIAVRMVDADDEVLPGLQAVLSLGFEFGGTAVGVAGVAERDAAIKDGDPGVANWRTKSAAGLLALAVAEHRSGPVGGGLHNPRGEVTELAGIATLPAFRHLGIASAVTAQLVADALERGVELCFLSAESDAVARIYGRIGFCRVGTSCTAEPPG